MSYFIVSFKNAFAYRSSVVFSIGATVVMVLVQIALWTYVYGNEPQMVRYMTAYVILSTIIGLFYSREMTDLIGGRVASGDFAYDLIRPTGLFVIAYQNLLGRLASQLLLRGAPLLLLFLPLLISAGPYHNLLPCLAAVLIGHALYTVLYTLLGLMAFVLIEVWAFRRLLDDTIRFISGAVVPLAIFPGWLQRVSDYLPFKYLYDFPLRLLLLLGQLSPEQAIRGILISLCWTTGLSVCLVLCYSGAIRRCTVQGG